MTTTASHNLVGAIVRYTGTLTDLRGECLVLGIRNESRAMCIVTLDPDERFSFLEGDNQPYSERDWFWCIQPGCTVPYHC